MAKYEKWLEPDGLLLLAAWARDGLTDEQIADKITVATSTLYDWKKRYPEISEALKRGKEVIDAEVENALLRNAIGYEYAEQVPIKVKEEIQKDGQKVVQERVEVVEVTKRKPPETVAQIYWLKNRKPEQWRDKQAAATDSALLDKLIDAVKDVE